MSFANMGKPIPNTRRDRAYQWAKDDAGVEREKAWNMVQLVSTQLERDHPHEGLKEACKTVDLTGAYRLFAILLTG